MSATRKHSRFEICERHRPWFAGETRRRILECFVEGGPGGWTPGCEGGRCRLWPGTDVFEPSVCFGELELEWTEAPNAELASAAENWIVEFEGDVYGPFASEDECYSFAARVSREPNDWTPTRLRAPASALQDAPKAEREAVAS